MTTVEAYALFIAPLALAAVAAGVYVVTGWLDRPAPRSERHAR